MQEPSCDRPGVWQCLEAVEKCSGLHGGSSCKCFDTEIRLDRLYSCHKGEIHFFTTARYSKFRKKSQTNVHKVKGKIDTDNKMLRCQILLAPTTSMEPSGQSRTLLPVLFSLFLSLSVLLHPQQTCQKMFEVMSSAPWRTSFSSADVGDCGPSSTGHLCYQMWQ